MRAINVLERLIYNSEYGICDLSKMAGLSSPSDIYRLLQGKDVKMGVLYRFCKIEGYQIIIFNPRDKSSYLINSEEEPLKVKDAGKITSQRKYPNHYVKGQFEKDVYTAQKVKKPYRPKRSVNYRYRKQVKFVQVKKEVKDDND